MTSIIFLFVGKAPEYHYVFLTKTNWMTSSGAQHGHTTVVEIIMMQVRQTADTAGCKMKGGYKNSGVEDMILVVWSDSFLEGKGGGNFLGPHLELWRNEIRILLEKIGPPIKLQKWSVLMSFFWEKMNETFAPKGIVCVCVLHIFVFSLYFC